MASYDVIIIGAGPGGYVCAIRCAQLGLKTAVVEGRGTLGGTCLNVGCIPSKALLHSSHMLHEAEHNFAAMGLKGKSPSVDWKQMLAYKDETVSQNTGGIEFLFKKNKIDWIKGWASIPGAGKVKVGDDTHEAKNIVIATGSEPASIPGVEIDEEDRDFLDRRARTLQGPEEAGGDRRRRDRARTGQRLCAAGVRRHRAGIPGCGLPRHGCRRAAHVQAHPRKTGARDHHRRGGQGHRGVEKPRPRSPMPPRRAATT